MSANISHRKRRLRALGLALHELPGWNLHLGCSRCRREAIAPTEAFPQQMKVSEVLVRARCRECRGCADSAHIHNGLKGRRSWTVKLAGPGALR
jgi:hypothetical protein